MVNGRYHELQDEKTLDKLLGELKQQ
jgi:hypothetical protein